VQFPDAANAEAVDGDALRDAASVLLLTGDDAVVRTHGRTARLDATTPTAEFGANTDSTPTPAVTWLVDRDGAAATATVTHAAGDPVEAERLTLETSDGETDRQFADAYETVDPGDSVTIAFEAASDGFLWISLESESGG